MSQEEKPKYNWTTSVEQVDRDHEEKEKEKFSSIPAENLPNTVYQKIMEDAKIEAYLNNKYMNIVGALMYVKFAIKGVREPIDFRIDAKKSDFMGSLQNELNEQILKLNLQGNQKIEFLNAKLFAYDDKELDKPAEERSSTGGSWMLI